MRLPSHHAQRACVEALSQQGFRVSRRGWPTFWAWDGSTVLFVIVKRKRTHRIKSSTRRLVHWLREYGVPVKLYVPEDGFRELCDGDLRDH